MPDSNPHNEPADTADDAQRALQAVQVALDRRDNGGSAGARRDQVGTRSPAGPGRNAEPGGTRSERGARRDQVGTRARRN
jgi:hypothetical protein